MYEAFRLAAFVVGVVQGAFLSVALLVKTTANRQATRTLAALVAVFTVLILGELVEVTGPWTGDPWITFVNINTELVIGPLLLLFVRYVFDPERPFRRGDALQFLPFLAGVAGWVGFYAYLGATSPRPSLDPYRGFVVVYVVVKAAFFYTYVILMFRTLRRELARARRFFAGRQAVEVGWLYHWLIGFTAIATLLYAHFFVNTAADVVPIDSDDFGSFVLAVMIYLVSLMVLLRPWVLSVRPRQGVGEARHAEDAARLEEHLERERPYLDPDLTLRELADALGLAENRLSAVINEGLGTSFYDLVNRSRLECFERLASDATLAERTVLELAYEAGFNSKASFYRVFRRVHDTTPSAFRKKKLEEMSAAASHSSQRDDSGSRIGHPAGVGH